MVTQAEELLGAARGQLAVSVSDRVATVQFTRPERRNAITFEMWDAFGRIFPALAEDASVDAVVVRGTPGGPFSAGADISEFATLRADVEGASRYSSAVERGGDAIIGFPRPTIAMIEGYAVGGGAEVALACDLRLCDTTARFAITPAKLGLVYSLPSTRRLVEIVGPAWARWILFTGEQFGADRAADLGMVHEVLPPGALERAAYGLAHRVSELARVSIEGAKALIRIASEAGGPDAPPVDAAAICSASVLSEEYREGVSAFLAKRAPQFRRVRQA